MMQVVATSLTGLAPIQESITGEGVQIAWLPTTTLNAVVDDGSCNYIEGCTLQEANNWNPSAVVDDGSCEFELSAFEPYEAEYISGCIDPAASNYDEDADIDDGSCEYIGGCKNPRQTTTTLMRFTTMEVVCLMES
jgi:hypothetical protein